jgi:diaminopimelate decarboxylase
LSAIASEKRRTVNVSLRVNPDVDALTHEKIATGNAEDKFGILIGSAREIYGVAAELPGINVAGVDVHIGSQITDLEPFESAFRMVADFVRELRTDGHAISHVDLGGGLGIPYLDDNDPPPDPDAYGALVKRAMRGLDCRLIFEPGRLIVGNAGILVTRVLYVKPGEAKNFVIVDAGMTELIRPTLYEAYHNIRPVMEPGHGARRMVADVVGPVCESGDFLALDRDLPEPKPGDLLAIMSAGAYGAVQGNTYNTRALAPEVLVRDAEWALVRPRVEVEKLIALDRLPPWL